MITYTNQLDIYPGNPPIVIKLSQYDTDFSLVFDLFASRGTFTIASGTTAAFREKKPDGNVISVDATLDIQNKRVTVAPSDSIAKQITAIAGKCVCELTLLKNGDELNTANFVLLVEKAPVDKDAIESDSVVRELVAVMDRADEIIEAAHEVEENVDPTLSVPGKSADAKVTGDRFGTVNSQIANANSQISQLQNNLNKKVNIPMSGNVPNHGVSGQVLRTKGTGVTEWATVGSPTDAQAEQVISEWLDEHPEATTTVEDGSITEAKLHPDLLDLIERSGGFPTPQLYGAIGDGVADDTEAISTCLDENPVVYIPAGYYRITNTISIKIKVRNTVICSDKAMFIADSTAFNSAIASAQTIDDRPSMLLVSGNYGWNFYGPTWFGGVFNCNNVTGLIGVKLNSVSRFTYFPKLFVTNIGDDGIGLYIRNASPRCYLGQVHLYGNNLTVDENGNWNASSDTNRTNTGLYVKESHDFHIADLVTMGCTVGVYSDNGVLIVCDAYHGWAGSTFTYTQYLKTRAFVGLNSSKWYFGEFYSDYCYIGAECDQIQCSKTRIISADSNGITGASGEIQCFALKMLSNAGSYDLGYFDFSTLGNTVFKGIDVGTINIYTAWPRRLWSAQIGNANNLKRLANTLLGCIGNRISTIEGEITANTWYVLGYLWKNADVWRFDIIRNNNDLFAEIDIAIVDSGTPTINATIFRTERSAFTVGIGTTSKNISGYTFIPIVIKRAARSGWVMTQIKSNDTLVLSPTKNMEVYSGSVTVTKELIAGS